MLNISTESRCVILRASYYFNKITSTHLGKVQIHRLEVERKVLSHACCYLLPTFQRRRFKIQEIQEPRKADYFTPFNAQSLPQ